MTSFHHETIQIEGKPVSAGDVLRLFDGPFGDGVILGFNDTDVAKVARPYVYAGSVGTTGPVALTGTEYILYSPADLKFMIGKRPILQHNKKV